MSGVAFVDPYPLLVSVDLDGAVLLWSVRPWYPRCVCIARWANRPSPAAPPSLSSSRGSARWGLPTLDAGPLGAGLTACGAVTSLAVVYEANGGGEVCALCRRRRRRVSGCVGGGCGRERWALMRCPRARACVQVAPGVARGRHLVYTGNEAGVIAAWDVTAVIDAAGVTALHDEQRPALRNSYNAQRRTMRCDSGGDGGDDEDDSAAHAAAVAALPKRKSRAGGGSVRRRRSSAADGGAAGGGGGGGASSARSTGRSSGGGGGGGGEGDSARDDASEASVLSARWHGGRSGAVTPIAAGASDDGDAGAATAVAAAPGARRSSNLSEASLALGRRVALARAWAAHGEPVVALSLVSEPPALLSSSTDCRVAVWGLDGAPLGALAVAVAGSDEERGARPWRLAVDVGARAAGAAEQAAEVLATARAADEVRRRRRRSSWAALEAVNVRLVPAEPSPLPRDVAAAAAAARAVAAVASEDAATRSRLFGQLQGDVNWQRTQAEISREAAFAAHKAATARRHGRGRGGGGRRRRRRGKRAAAAKGEGAGGAHAEMSAEKTLRELHIMERTERKRAERLFDRSAGLDDAAAAAVTVNYADDPHDWSLGSRNRTRLLYPALSGERARATPLGHAAGGAAAPADAPSPFLVAQLAAAHARESFIRHVRPLRCLEGVAPPAAAAAAGGGGAAVRARPASSPAGASRLRGFGDGGTVRGLSVGVVVGADGPAESAAAGASEGGVGSDAMSLSTNSRATGGGASAAAGEGIAAAAATAPGGGGGDGGVMPRGTGGGVGTDGGGLPPRRGFLPTADVVSRGGSGGGAASTPARAASALPARRPPLHAPSARHAREAGEAPVAIAAIDGIISAAGRLTRVRSVGAAGAAGARAQRGFAGMARASAPTLGGGGGGGGGGGEGAPPPSPRARLAALSRLVRWPHRVRRARCDIAWPRPQHATRPMSMSMSVTDATEPARRRPSSAKGSEKRRVCVCVFARALCVCVCACARARLRRRATPSSPPPDTGAAQLSSQDVGQLRLLAEQRAAAAVSAQRGDDASSVAPPPDASDSAQRMLRKVTGALPPATAMQSHVKIAVKGRRRLFGPYTRADVMNFKVSSTRFCSLVHRSALTRRPPLDHVPAHGYGRERNYRPARVYCGQRDPRQRVAAAAYREVRARPAVRGGGGGGVCVCGAGGCWSVFPLPAACSRR